jgi:hypothetical protein
VQLGDRDPEALKRPPGEQVEHLIQTLRERIERSPEPVVVELAGGDPERLRHGEALAPIGEAQERARMREPVANKRFDHLHRHPLRRPETGPYRLCAENGSRASTIGI